MAMTTNIESQEFRRRQVPDDGIEHPRASSSDDVECFFSILHEHLGNDFTVKTVKERWVVTCHELRKRLDPSLPFFYHTSDKNRYRTSDLPTFDEPSDKKNRADALKFSRREHVGATAIGRASMISRGTKSIRQTFHAGPVSLPPT